MTALSSSKQDFPVKKISGWSNTTFSNSQIATPKNAEEVCSIIKIAKQEGKRVIARGAGLSYGDGALNEGNIVVDMSIMNTVLNFDEISGLLQVQSGVTYEQALACSLKTGWVLPVITGTRYVTMGGALANNVHGKNSYACGNFGEWVREFKIALASGECLVCSREANTDLFFGVIGGAGLFGIVTEITIQLIRIPSSYLNTEKITAVSLRDLLTKLDTASEKNDFAIAQVDSFAQKSDLGRGAVSSGTFVESDKGLEKIDEMRSISKTMFGVFPKKLIPVVGRIVLNNYTMKLVSKLKYQLDKKTNTKEPLKQDVFHFTFLLDGLPNWKHVFRHGFYEHQPLIPKEKAQAVISELITLSHEYGMPSYLSAIKVHRKDDFLISYSMDGYSFSLDIPRRPHEKEKQNELFRKINKIIIKAGGIVYLAKDANLTAYEFRQMYKNVDKFMELKKKYDPDELFQSDMYRRIFQVKDDESK